MTSYSFTKEDVDTKKEKYGEINDLSPGKIAKDVRVKIVE